MFPHYFSKISHFLERILIEHIDIKNSLEQGSEEKKSVSGKERLLFHFARKKEKRKVKFFDLKRKKEKRKVIFQNGKSENI